MDIKNTYRAVSIHPCDREHQGIVWDSGQGLEMLIDNRICMGLSWSPYIFTMFSNFIVRAFSRGGVPDVIIYLDNVAVTVQSWHECAWKGQLIIF